MTRIETSESARVLVIGLDGGSLSLCCRLADEGHMPFLGSMLRSGISGEMASTIPPITPAAWTTMVTGKNPGKHGVYDFTRFRTPVGHVELVDSLASCAEPVWSILSHAGKRVGVVNVPLTYPPQPVNGVLITGMFTPSTNETFTYPPELYDKLKAELGEYIISVPWRARRAGQLLRDLTRCTQQRGAYIRSLIKREPWDFFMAVFTETDTLQHALWSYFDPDDERASDPKIEKAVYEYYRVLDSQLVQICDLVGPEVRVFFVSDHGFGQCRWFVRINTWLCKQGLLVFDPVRLAKLRRQKQFGKFLRSRPFFHRLIRRSLELVSWGSPSGGHLPQNRILDAIDWENTRAFSVLGQGIRINLKGRDPKGIVNPGREYEELRETIIGKLCELNDPQTGSPFRDAAWKREDVYSGPHVQFAPDIVGYCSDGRFLVQDFPHETIVESTGADAYVVGLGTHCLQGLLIAHGPGIKRTGELTGVQLRDVAPTVLYSLDQPIPADMDGRVLSDIFEPEVLSARQPRIVETSDLTERSDADALNGQEHQDDPRVIERLRALGYLE